jgi:hypothetical protein
MIGSRGFGAKVEFVVSRVRVAHPEFGYLGSSRFCRTCVALLVCGLIAGAISVGIFNLEPDRDPLDAMALAPAETLIDPKPAQPGTQSQKKTANASSAEKIDEEGTNASSKAALIKPTCRKSLGEVPEGDCTPVRVVRVRPLRAVNERPLIAAVPIGRRDDPAMLPAPPPTAVAASPPPAAPPEVPKAAPAPPETSLAEATPADAVPAVEPAPPAPMPTVTSKKARPRVHHAQNEPRRRNHYSYEPSYNARSSSYRTRECQVRICERLGVKFPGPTRPSLQNSAQRYVWSWRKLTFI